MVTDGDLKGSPKRNLMAVQNIDSQKLFVIRTEPKKKGQASRLPPMHIQAFIIGLPLPNLSLMIPPPSEEQNPQHMLIRE